MRALTHGKSPLEVSVLGVTVVGLFFFGFASCSSPDQSARPAEEAKRRAEPSVEPGWPKSNPFFTQVSYQSVVATVPKVEGAEMVNDDEICAQCHDAHAKSFANNVHRNESCEGCHGPASRHVETRGKEPGLIFSFRTGDPAIRAEACLKCHEQDACTEGARWRTSKHAHMGVTCADCHRGHYNLPLGTPAVTESKQANGMDGVPLTTVHLASVANFKPAQPSLKGTSQHLAAVAPNICYRCHCDFQEFQEVAGPHQIGGANGFNCTTCHDPHGQILESSRQDLCLTCHKGAPTMAWHSAIHHLNGVACTDCHNPHPRACVSQFIEVNHEQVARAKRRVMAVDEPSVCYKCHPKIYGLNALPSHHPIKEGKMVCSGCHDPHGGETANLKEATINLTCYKCHGEFQGPFVIEHPPVRENCCYCHNPHGAVANHLLKRPATFLCLGCHTGHNQTHPPGSVGLQMNLDKTLQPNFYTDCTQCHSQIHGSNRADQRGYPSFQR